MANEFGWTDHEMEQGVRAGWAFKAKLRELVEAIEASDTAPTLESVEHRQKVLGEARALAGMPTAVAAPERGVGEQELRAVCHEAYQVVGSLLSDLGKFNTPEAQKVLDNLSNAKLVHKDVLPWPSYEKQGDAVPDDAAMFSSMHEFLLWNRAQPEPLVKIAYEYGAFRKAVELYLATVAANKAPQ